MAENLRKISLTGGSLVENDLWGELEYRGNDIYVGFCLDSKLDSISGVTVSSKERFVFPTKSLNPLKLDFEDGIFRGYSNLGDIGYESHEGFLENLVKSNNAEIDYSALIVAYQRLLCHLEGAIEASPGEDI